MLRGSPRTAFSSAFLSSSGSHFPGNTKSMGQADEASEFKNKDAARFLQVMNSFVNKQVPVQEILQNNLFPPRPLLPPTPTPSTSQKHQCWFHLMVAGNQKAASPHTVIAF